MNAVDARLPSGTVTFLFTDVEGSTRMWASDTEAMSASLLVHDAILRGAIEGNGGYVFTTAGDSFAAAFGRVRSGVGRGAGGDGGPARAEHRNLAGPGVASAHGPASR